MDIQQLRAEIDTVDYELVALFTRRMAASAAIADYKKEQGLPVLDRARERDILCTVSDLAGPELEDYVRVLYSTLFDVSRSHQHNLNAADSALAQRIRAAAEQTPALFPTRGTVAYQGVEGAYSQMACDKLFSAPSLMSFRSFEGVFQAVEQGLCQYGVLPIENSSFGSVGSVYDLMRRYRFSIVRSIKLHIDHNLLARPGARLEDIAEIFSHEQAIGQCAAFLAALPNVKVTVCANTAEAALRVSESGRGDVAAISSRSCADLYGLTVLKEHVQDRENNYTRFICITKDLAIYPGANRISLMFSVPHRPGALYEMIARFSAQGLNLTKLESRPLPGSDFEFQFYFDLEASALSDKVAALLGALANENASFVFLGCYSEV